MLFFSGFGFGVYIFVVVLFVMNWYREGFMEVVDYLGLVGRFGDGYCGGWDVLAVSPDESVFLVRDCNGLCFVSCVDFGAMLPFGVALAEGVVWCFLDDCGFEGRLGGKLVEVVLSGVVVEWLGSEGIKGLVRSVECNQ